MTDVASEKTGSEIVKKPQEYEVSFLHFKKCNVRLEDIAKPNKYRLKRNFKEYKHNLPERNIEGIIHFLREEFGKPPEEIECSFLKLKEKYKIRKSKLLVKREARKLHKLKLRNKKRKIMLNHLKDILKRYITKAYFNPKHIIMTGRLRRISNTVLQEMCNLRGIPVPRRESTNIRAQLMSTTADFLAFCIDTIYYELQVQKVTDYEKLKEQKQLLNTCPPV